MSTAADLATFAKLALGSKKFIVALNSESYIHQKTLSGIAIKRGSGGAQNLLDGILKKIGGLMVAVSSGNADKQVVDEKGRIQVPSENEAYTLKRIFLGKEDMDNYYYGFANQTLWPMCHLSFVKPLFEHRWWEGYKKVNQKFADAILEELEDDDAFVWVNDYQLCLVPQMLKEKRPNIIVGTFWHIPWPIKEVMNICPWRKEILEGLFASDFIGFHRNTYYRNFIDCAVNNLDIAVFPSTTSMLYKNHVTKVGALPAGVDYSEIEICLEEIKADEDTVKKEFDFDYQYLAIGVDRVDYTKGLMERLYIIDTFLQKYPEFKKKFVHLMIGAPTRTHIPVYKNLHADVMDLVGKINWKYSDNGWEPIKFINESLPREKLFAYYKNSHVCMVTSLDDGMNLVAKEYGVCNEPDKGALLLSQFTGASLEMTSAILINPYDTEASADALYQALTMKASEKLQRNKNMRQNLRQNNIYKWGKQFIECTVAKS